MFRRTILTAALPAVLIVLAVVSVACGGDDDQDDSSGPGTAAFDRVPAPNEDAPEGSKVFVGHDKDNTSGVGLIVFSDSKAVAYACDGDSKWTWFAGTVSGGEAKLESADGVKFTAEINGASVTGRAGSGGSLEFALEPASERGGLYRASFTKGSDTEVAGWVVENDGTVRGGIGASLAGKKLTLGASLSSTNLSAVQGLPEFPALKAVAPQYPTLPADRAVFSQPGGICGRIATTLLEQGVNGTTVVPNTLANRTRLGLLGRLGCAQADGLFVVA